MTLAGEIVLLILVAACAAGRLVHQGRVAGFGRRR